MAEADAAAAAAAATNAAAAADSDFIISPGPEDPNVLTKYKDAAEIVNKTLQEIKAELCDGASVIDLCVLGDKSIQGQCDKVYTKAFNVDPDTGEKKKLDKGIAFPTNISPNQIACHLSPLSSDDIKLKSGDVVKIDLGCHIDGYIATLAVSCIVPEKKGEAAVAVSGKAANAIQAAYVAAEAALRLLRPGKSNYDVSKVIEQVAKDYQVNVVEGVLSHQMKKDVIDGNKTILAKPTVDQRVEPITFEENEVYAIDIAMSSGDGKLKETNARTTIFKRRLDVEYMLKLKASRQVISEINTKFLHFPFVLRSLGDENKGKLGITECLNHNMVVGYPVLYEKDGEFVARFKYTVLILPKYSLKITNYELPILTSDLAVTDQLVKELLEMPVGKPVKAKKEKA